MNRVEYLLSCLAEECAEVSQRCTKAQRFGLDEVQPDQVLTNAQRIMGEYLDLLAVMEMLQEETGLFAMDEMEVSNQISAKKAKVERFATYSVVECGTLQR